MRASAGLSLVEVTVALFIFAVGVIAAASLQVSALRASSTARTVQEVTNAARTEMELQRQAPKSGCQAAVPEGYSCTAEVSPCRVQGGALVCGAATSAELAAHQVTVTVTGPQDRAITLRTVVRR